jgi:hypothetical protein
MQMRSPSVDRVGQQLRGLGGAFQAFGRLQPGQRVVQLIGRTHAARCEQPRQQRRDAGLFQRPDGARRHVAGQQLRAAHSASSTGAVGTGGFHSRFHHGRGCAAKV